MQARGLGIGGLLPPQAAAPFCPPHTVSSRAGQFPPPENTSAQHPPTRAQLPARSPGPPPPCTAAPGQSDPRPLCIAIIPAHSQPPKPSPLEPSYPLIPASAGKPPEARPPLDLEPPTATTGSRTRPSAQPPAPPNPSPAALQGPNRPHSQEQRQPLQSHQLPPTPPPLLGGGD